jgi:MOSC domain-containing protein YiiM
MNATVLNIYIAKNAGDKMIPLQQASLIPGRGIEGDRYYNEKGTFSEKLKDNPAAELTLIEKEEIDTFNDAQNLNIRDADFRRNIVTRGIKLNDLVDKTFSIGQVTLKGIRLCEPCSYLANTVNEQVLPHLTGRGGLRAQILSVGSIKVGEYIIDDQIKDYQV